MESFSIPELSSRFIASLVLTEAQLAVDGDAGKHPEFRGNGKTVNARPLGRDFDSNPNQVDHTDRNAETCPFEGDALGRAMAEILAR